VEVNSQGTVSWYSREFDNRSCEGSHPLKILGKIEQVQLRELTFGEEGLIIEVNSLPRDIIYGGNGTNSVFVLKNGNFVPLEKVSFSSRDFCSPIHICKREYYNVLTPENRTTGENNIVFLPEKKTSCFTVFTEEDLSKAEMFVYTENKETVTVYPNAGYMLINNITVVPTVVSYSESKTRYKNPL